MAERIAGFYWARRKDDGSLTVVELVTRQGSPYFQLLGNLNIPDESEIGEWFDILDRIQEPATNLKKPKTE